MKAIQSIRGMNDILPDVVGYWHWVETLCRQVTQNYGYQEIRFPILEQTALFARSIGDVTDIVEKEMYSFLDRDGESLSLRPEGTASCVRAALEHGLLHHHCQRLWYMGPMFRHERPQKGRYRQFHQLGVEALGMANPEADVEIILLAKRLLQQLNLYDDVVLQINTLGTLESRQCYRERLIEYYRAHYSELDEDSRLRLERNPLRILDSKNPEMQTLNQLAPQLIDYLDSVSAAHFKRVCDLLTALSIPFTVVPTLVRGLDYYCHTVFEWVTRSLGAQGTVCAGGRYDYLIAQLGGRPTPAVGFAMGLERIILLLQQRQHCEQHADVFFVMVGQAAYQYGLYLSELLRDALPKIQIEMNLIDASFKAQFKRADKSGANYAVIIAEDELAQGMVTLKHLRQDLEQQQFTPEALLNFFRSHDHGIYGN